MLSKLLIYGRRQLHTIVSKDIIKPSSPTPSQHKTYNLSLFDQIAINSYTPIVAFYPNPGVRQSSHGKTLDLKKSLSQTLSQYYPFAGRVPKSLATCVDCNDEGVEFIEATNDSSLSDFLQQSEHEDFDQLIPNDLIWFEPHIKGDTEGIACPLTIQVNHFACGGVAVASCLNHKVGDARSLLNFINHWAAVTAQKDTSSINPHMIPYPHKKNHLPDILSDKSRSGCVTRNFRFPNQKLSDLKAKVTTLTMESRQPIVNPTRVEVLSWLLHKCAMEAAKQTNSENIMEKSGMLFPTDMRGILVEKLPGTSIGNLNFVIDVPTGNESELAPHMSIGEMRKKKAAFQSIPNLETASEIVAGMSPETALETSKKLDPYYVYSSLCRFPTYEIDFGWGKPVKVILGGTVKNVTILMSAPDGNGIDALVCLEKQDMKIFQNDPELLAFC